jgi:hypothetical protein
MSDTSKTVGIKLRLEESDFAANARAKIREIEDTVRLRVKIIFDRSGFDREMRAVRAEQAAMNAADPLSVSPSNSPPAGTGRHRAEIDVNANTARAEAEIDHAARNRRSEIDIDVDKGGKAQAGASNLFSTIGMIGGQTFKIIAVSAAVFQIGAMAISAIGAVTTLSQGLMGLVGIAGLLPAALMGGAAILGTMVAAFHGMGDSLSALDAAKNPKASTVDPVADAIARRNAVNAISQAEANAADSSSQASRNLADAKKAEALAYKEAQKEIKQITSDYNNALLAERGASQSAIDAADALRQAQSNPGTSPGELKALTLARDIANQKLVDEKNRVQELTLQKADATKKGVDGSDKVVMARRNEADAEKALAKAQVDGARSIEQAKEQLFLMDRQRAIAAAAAGVAVQQALDKMTPAGREAAIAISEVRQRLKEVADIAQESFFIGFATPFKNLADVIIPQLKVGVGELAGSMGRGLQDFMNSLSSSLGGGVLERMFGNLTEASDQMNRAIEPLTRSFVKITDVGMTFLPQLARAWGDMATRFCSFIDRVTADGSLKKWIQGGLDVAKQLGDILGSAWSILGSITDAASAAGSSTLTDFVDGAKAVADVMKGEPFQSNLRMVFEGANGAVRALGPGLRAIGDMFNSMAPTLKVLLPLVGAMFSSALTGVAGGLADPTFQKGLIDLFTGVKEGIDALIPYLPGIAHTLGEVMTAVGDLGRLIGQVLGPAFETLSKVIKPVVEFLDKFFKNVSSNKDAIEFLGKAIATIVEIWALWTAAQWLLNIAMAANPIGLIILLIGLLVAAIVTLIAKWPEISKAIGDAAAAIGQFFVDLGKGYKKWQDETIAGVGQFFVDLGHGYKKWQDETLAGIGQFFVDMGHGYKKHQDEAVATTSNGLTDMGHGYKKWQDETLGMFGDFFKNTGGMFVDFWNNAGKGTGDFVKGIVEWFQKLPEEIHKRISELGNFLGGAGEALMKRFADGIRNAVSHVTNAVTDVFKRVQNFFPHSPAPEGPFSGKGWTDVGDSGGTIIEEHGDGMIRKIPDLKGKVSQVMKSIDLSSMKASVSSVLPSMPSLAGAAGGGTRGGYGVNIEHASFSGPSTANMMSDVNRLATIRRS